MPAGSSPLRERCAMAANTFKRIFLFAFTPPHTTTATTAAIFIRSKTTSSQYVLARARDPTFEKLMDNYKNLLKVISIQDLILSSSITTPSTPNLPSVSIQFLNRLSQRLHLNRGATSFLHKYPHIFHIFNHPIEFQPFCTLTPIALQIIQQESEVINNSLPLVVDRLVKLLSISITKTVPLRAIFKVWKEFGLPDDFEDSVIAKNPSVFFLSDGNERNTHYLNLISKEHNTSSFVASVENWRVAECCKQDCSVDRTTIRYRFKHSYPTGMIIRKTYKAKVEKWQRLPYIGPYDEMGIEEKRKTKYAMKRMEKRAVGIAHEFLNLTVEKMIEVEKFSQFRKWFGIDLNIRDLFLDHPGMFYLSTKGKRHTVFLREAYTRGCLIEPNPVYDARRKLLHLVAMGRRGLFRRDDDKLESNIHGDQEPTINEESSEEEEEDCDDEVMTE